MDQDFSFFGIFKTKTSIIIKFLWIIVLGFSIFGLGYYISGCYDKLKVTPEILVNENFVNSRTIPFPAITICPSLTVKTEYLDLSDYYEYIIYDETPPEEEQLIMAASAQVCSMNAMYIQQTPNRKPLNENIVETLDKVSPTIEDFLKVCQTNNVNGCESLFIRSITLGGYCFTFNMLNHESVFKDTITKDFDVYKYELDDSTNGSTTWSLEKGYSTNDELVRPYRASNWQLLNVLTKIYDDDLPNSCGTRPNAYRLYIHLPNEVAVGMHQFTFVDWDSYKFMRINAVVKKMDESIRNFPIEHRGCYFENERELMLYKSYTKTNCETECITNVTLIECGCVKFSMPRAQGMKVCGFEDLQCLDKIVGTWPNFYYKDFKNDGNFQDFPCDCLPSCTQINYNVMIESSSKRKFSSENLTYTSLQMLFGSTQIIETTNYVTYKIQNFVSDIGGLVGLFLGLSLLSIFEFLLKSLSFLRRYLNRKIQTNSEESSELIRDRSLNENNVRMVRSFQNNHTVIDIESLQNRRERERQFISQNLRFNALSAKNLESLFHNN